MGEEEDLLAVSQALGRDVFAIQGGGGNSSFKRADGVMLVKASGRAMGELTDMGGFVAVDPAGLRAGLAACAAEADYAALLAACVVGAGGRPSIETGLHALMGRCVLHSHSLWANVLCCAHGGQGLLADLFPAADYVPYAMPGLPLAQALAARAPLADVVFLENHGLIVSADTPQAALARHDAVVARLMAAMPGAGAVGMVVPDGAPAMPVLFPDAAVYLANRALASSAAGRQTLAAQAFLLAAMAAQGLSPRPLSNADCAALLGLEAEAYRQKMALEGGANP